MSKIGHQAFQLLNDPELNKVAQRLMDEGYGRYFYVDTALDGVTIWPGENSEHVVDVSLDGKQVWDE